MATHSSILAWRIPWTEGMQGYSPGGLQSIRVAVRHHKRFSMCAGCHLASDLVNVVDICNH